MSDRSTKSRLSARRKAEVVIRVMRGEEVDALSRELQVPAHQIARWREEFLSAGTDALKARARGPDRGRLRAAQAKVGELAMQVEILQELFQKRGLPLPPATRRRSS